MSRFLSPVAPDLSPMFVIELTYQAPLAEIDARMKGLMAFLRK